jgi:hypothetical protein
MGGLIAEKVSEAMTRWTSIDGLEAISALASAGLASGAKGVAEVVDCATSLASPGSFSTRLTVGLSDDVLEVGVLIAVVVSKTVDRGTSTAGFAAVEVSASDDVLDDDSDGIGTGGSIVAKVSGTSDRWTSSDRLEASSGSMSIDAPDEIAGLAGGEASRVGMAIG